MEIFVRLKEKTAEVVAWRKKTRRMTRSLDLVCVALIWQIDQNTRSYAWLLASYRRRKWRVTSISVTTSFVISSWLLCCFPLFIFPLCRLQLSIKSRGKNKLLSLPSLVKYRTGWFASSLINSTVATSFQTRHEEVNKNSKNNLNYCKLKYVTAYGCPTLMHTAVILTRTESY